MLVLARKVNESIVIGEGDGAIELVVTKIQGNKMWLGIKAPREVVIRRKELKASAADSFRLKAERSDNDRI